MPPLSIGQSKCAVKQGPVWPNDLDSRTLSLKEAPPLKYCEKVIYICQKHFKTYSTIGKNEIYDSVSIWNLDEEVWS